MLLSLGSRLIAHDAGSHDAFLLGVKPLDLVRGSENEVGKETEQDCQAAKEYANVPPRLHAVGVVRGALANAVHYELRDNAHASVGGAPDDGAHGVLTRDVKGCSDQQESWRDGALGEALEGAQHHELGEIVGEANAEHNDSPDEHAGGQSVAQRSALHEVVAGSFADEIHDVEDGGQPGELLPNEACVFAHPERGLRRNRSLIGLLGAVAYPHERKQDHVDLA